MRSFRAFVALILMNPFTFGARDDAIQVGKAAKKRVENLFAKRIIEGRPYGKVEDLLKINGIGAKTLQKMRPYVKGD